jgi:hypothetical protein
MGDHPSAWQNSVMTLPPFAPLTSIPVLFLLFSCCKQVGQMFIDSVPSKPQ